MMYFFLIIPFLVALLILCILLFTDFSNSSTSATYFPKVSVLLAVRNEEQNIERCLTALAKQEYSNIEVWIGDDMSTDKTAFLVQEFCAKYPHFHYFLIQKKVAHLQGKANVLAQLVHQTDGEFLLMTDADIEVSPTWIQTFCEQYEQGIGIMTGVTTIEKKTTFAVLQSIDWIFSFLMIKFLSDKKVPVTALGNNLFVHRKAYFDIGGYENIPFSVTEDFALFHAIVQKGWGFKHLFLPTIKAVSMPVLSFYELLQQRKRWTKGAVELPIWIKLLLINQVLYFVVLGIFFTTNPYFSCFIFLLKVTLQSLFLRKQFSKINEKVAWFYLIYYEFYQAILGISLLIFYCLPIKINWKERRY